MDISFGNSPVSFAKIKTANATDGSVMLNAYAPGADIPLIGIDEYFTTSAFDKLSRVSDFLGEIKPFPGSVINGECLA